MVDLWGRRWAKDELLARVGRLEQLAGVQRRDAIDAFTARTAALSRTPVGTTPGGRT